jgi:hypothetical protein
VDDKRQSCTLCKNFSMEDGHPSCTERPKVNEIEDFPFKDTDCKHYWYVLDFSKLYNRSSRTHRAKD